MLWNSDGSYWLNYPEENYVIDKDSIFLAWAVIKSSNFLCWISFHQINGVQNSEVKEALFV